MVSASKLAAEISSVFAKLVVPSDQRSKLYLPFADTVTSANGFTDLVSRDVYKRQEQKYHPKSYQSAAA